MAVYLRGIVPLLGAILSTRAPYRYLSDSMRAFPRPEAFLREMETAGLAETRLVPLPPAPAWIAVGRVSE
jgi:ubiquinone/menaquinone biosynthesis C-methylase UbiE